MKHTTPSPLPPTSRASELFDLVHADLSGPITPESIGKAQYTLCLLDDCTRFSYIYFFKNKSDTGKCIKDFCEKVKTQTGRYPRALRTDNGGECINHDLDSYCSTKGIDHQTIAAYSHEFNSPIERYHQTLQHMV